MKYPFCKHLLVHINKNRYCNFGVIKFLFLLILLFSALLLGKLLQKRFWNLKPLLHDIFLKNTYTPPPSTPPPLHENYTWFIDMYVWEQIIIMYGKNKYSKWKMWRKLISEEKHWLQRYATFVILFNQFIAVTSFFTFPYIGECKLHHVIHKDNADKLDFTLSCWLQNCYWSFELKN